MPAYCAPVPVGSDLKIDQEIGSRKKIEQLHTKGHVKNKMWYESIFDNKIDPSD